MESGAASSYGPNGELAGAIIDFVAFIHISEQGQLCAYNQAFLGLLGLFEPAQNRDIHHVFEDSPELLDLITKTLKEHQPLYSQLLNYEFKQSIRHVVINAKWVSTSEVPKGVLFTFTGLDNVSSFGAQIRRTERLDTIGKIASGIAHEIRNPLASMRGFLQIMQTNFKEYGLAREIGYSELMMHDMDSMECLVKQLLLLTKPAAINWEKIDVGSMIDAWVPSIRAEADRRGVELIMGLDAVPLIMGDRTMLILAMEQLVSNAFEAMENGGRLTIKVIYDKVDGKVRLSIGDTGLGIPSYMVDRIFDVFYSTKASGIGLGLPITQRIVAELGGDIKVSTKGYGTTFSIDIALASGE